MFPMIKTLADISLKMSFARRYFSIQKEIRMNTFRANKIWIEGRIDGSIKNLTHCDGSTKIPYLIMFSRATLDVEST